MGTGRVVVVSDSHLSERTPEAGENWAAVVRYIEATGPDLVVHVGDLSLDGAHETDDLVHARAELDRLPAPCAVVPGNHDVGDNPASSARPDDAITAERLQRWHDVVGQDHWAHQLDGWQFIGVDAQLFGSGLADEDEQWAFLEAAFGRSGASRRVLVTHKPLAAGDRELAVAPAHRFVPLPARRRLSDLAAGSELVLSGHVHQYRSLRLGVTSHVWAPTTWAVLPDTWQAPVGAKRCGVLVLDLDGPGTPAMVEPDGLSQLTITVDVAGPYDEIPAGEA